jgi:hypothetical protein
MTDNRPLIKYYIIDESMSRRTSKLRSNVFLKRLTGEDLVRYPLGAAEARRYRLIWTLSIVSATMGIEKKLAYSLAPCAQVA